MLYESIYKRILLKINLSKNDLLELKRMLNVKNTCSGPFIEKNKMCPVTNALALKNNIDIFKSKDKVHKQLKKYNINKLELYLFYLFFDLPTIFSRNLFKKGLNNLKEVVNGLAKNE